MVENHLVDSLLELVKEAVKDFRLPTKNGELEQPQVFDFDLPMKEANYTAACPFIIVRADNGQFDRDDSDMELYIIIGCYSENHTANRDCKNVMSRIRIALTTLPGEILAKRYCLQFPIKWDLHGEQPQPYSQLDMRVKFSYNTPQAPSEGG